MNFMKYPTKNDISISNAVLKLAKLQNAERLELTAATGAVIVTSGRMTAKELLSTVQSLTGRAAELMTLLRLTCGDCTNCSEECAYRDKSIAELIRPAVVVPDWARQDAGLAGDAKLDCYVDEDSGEISVCEADYEHDLSDVPPELLFALHQSGCCLSALEDAIHTAGEGGTVAHVLPEEELPMNATGLETLDNIWDLFETTLHTGSAYARTRLFEMAKWLEESQNLLDWIEQAPKEKQVRMEQAN